MADTTRIIETKLGDETVLVKGDRHRWWSARCQARPARVQRRDQDGRERGRQLLRRHSAIAPKKASVEFGIEVAVKWASWSGRWSTVRRPRRSRSPWNGESEGAPVTLRVIGIHELVGSATVRIEQGGEHSGNGSSSLRLRAHRRPCRRGGEGGPATRHRAVAGQSAEAPTAKDRAARRPRRVRPLPWPDAAWLEVAATAHPCVPLDDPWPDRRLAAHALGLGLRRRARAGRAAGAPVRLTYVGRIEDTVPTIRTSCSSCGGTRSSPA